MNKKAFFENYVLKNTEINQEQLYSIMSTLKQTSVHSIFVSPIICKTNLRCSQIKSAKLKASSFSTEYTMDKVTHLGSMQGFCYCETFLYFYYNMLRTKLGHWNIYYGKLLTSDNRASCSNSFRTTVLQTGGNICSNAVNTSHSVLTYEE